MLLPLLFARPAMSFNREERGLPFLFTSLGPSSCRMKRKKKKKVALLSLLDLVFHLAPLLLFFFMPHRSVASSLLLGFLLFSRFQQLGFTRRAKNLRRAERKSQGGKMGAFRYSGIIIREGRREEIP